MKRNVNSGPTRGFTVVKRGERNVLAVLVAHVKLADVFGVGAVFAFGLDVNLPLPAEAIEVIDEVATHERLDRAIDIVEVYALLQHLVAVHVDKLLGYARQECGADAGNFRTLAGRFQEGVQVLARN